MTLLKKMMLAVSLLVASSFASAAVYDLDLINNTVDTKVVGIGTTGSFGDFFNFTLADDLVVNQVMDTLGSFSFLGYDLYDSAGISLFGSAAIGLDGKLRIENLFLAAGNYTSYVTGVLDSSFGSYAFTTSVSPVPEASTLAMLLGGLGLVGFMARRRKVA
ncbi:hypothetical protein MNBD_GAMMA04-2113 [hydrothermal vent metagenome]|uniref:Ice-binding protein C-terminal domain-containing protein n=1 Tax=hydrothermal vent metagenome TaxID=652676 RepID=A0A3B0W778_9ZZZZ